MAEKGTGSYSGIQGQQASRIITSKFKAVNPTGYAHLIILLEFKGPGW